MVYQEKGRLVAHIIGIMSYAPLNAVQNVLPIMRNMLAAILKTRCPPYLSSSWELLLSERTSSLMRLSPFVRIGAPLRCHRSNYSFVQRGPPYRNIYIIQE